MRGAREDVEMGGNSPGKRDNPQTPEPIGGLSASASPDELQLVQPPTLNRNPALPTPAGPIRAGKLENGPTATVNNSTKPFTGIGTKIPKLKPKSPVKVQSNWFLQPALPLKPSTKRAKRPVSEVQSPEQARPKPQKSTSSASKAEERVWLSKAREYVNMAHLNNPVYSGILQAIDAVLDGKSGESWQTRAESMLAKLESQLSAQKTKTDGKLKKSEPPVQPTYAEVVKPTTTKTKATTTTDAPKKTKKSLQATTPVMSKEKARTQTKESQQLVLLIKKGQEIPPYSAMSIRDGINKAIAEKENERGPVVGSVKTSTSGNIVLTTITPYSANTLEKTLPVWRGVFKDFPIHS